MAQYCKCHVLGLGVAIGVTWALGVFLLGLTAMSGWGASMVTALGSLYIGYEATFLGSIIGLIWAFVDGFIAGAIIAWVYNKFVK